MYKKTLTYEDFNGEKVTEDVYFNLSKAELLEMHYQSKGGLRNYLESIINARDTATLAALFKDLLLKSYGVKDPSGKKFIKNDSVREDFECSIPFDIMYTTLATDAKEAAAFVNGIIPKELVDEMEKQQVADLKLLDQ